MGADWVVLSKSVVSGKDTMECLRCGERAALKWPMPVSEFSEKADSFTTLHSRCKQDGA